MNFEDGKMMSTLTVFPMDFGWCGLLGSERTVHRLMIGHTTADEVRVAMNDWVNAPTNKLQRRWRFQTVVRSSQSRKAVVATQAVSGSGTVGIPEHDWFPELRTRLQRYAQGVPTRFDDVIVEFPQSTEFQKRVIQATRRIKYGETVTYRELAASAGSPKAARAVGNVMAGNRFPIIVPCHRVVAAAGKLGGFSAPQGADLKEKMLFLEAQAFKKNAETQWQIVYQSSESR